MGAPLIPSAVPASRLPFVRIKEDSTDSEIEEDAVLEYSDTLEVIPDPDPPVDP